MTKERMEITDESTGLMRRERRNDKREQKNKETIECLFCNRGNFLILNISRAFEIFLNLSKFLLDSYLSRSGGIGRRARFRS